MAICRSTTVRSPLAAGPVCAASGPMAIALCIPLSYYMSPVAAIGFLVAGIMGVPFTRYGLRRGWGGQTSGVISPEFCSGILAEGNRPVCAQGTMHPAHIDSMGFHLALAGLV